MFAPHCPRHGRRVLLGHDDITSIINAPGGIVVEWTCTCGHHGRSSLDQGTATVGRRAGRLLV